MNDHDYFDRYNKSTVQRENNKITKRIYGDVSIYGALSIPYHKNLKYEWVFQINKGDDIVIGIDESKCKWICSRFSKHKSTVNYGYNSLDGKLNKLKYGDKYGKGSTISMILDMNAKTLQFKKNNISYKKISIVNRKVSYSMVVSLRYHGSSVSLLSFKSQSNLQEIEEDLEEKGNDLAMAQIDVLSKQNLQYINQYSLLLTQNEQYKKENSSQKQRILSLENEIKKLQLNNDKLTEEQKELQIENMKLKKEVKRLRINNIDINTVNYKNWEWEEILIWIISLENGRYMKYESILEQALSAEEVRGIHLEKVNESDVKGWGVKTFVDKKDITQSIRELTQKDQEEMINANDDNEGAQTAMI